MTLVSIARQLVATIGKMILTLSGENSFGVQFELRRIIQGFIKNHGDLAVEQIDASEASESAVKDALTSLPFLTSTKLVVLRQVSGNQSVSEQIEQFIIQVPDTTEVVIVEERLDKRSSLYKFLKNKTDFKEFQSLDAFQVVRWVGDQTKKLSGTITPGTARYLVERIGTNQERLNNELSKLVLYDKAITKQSVDLLTDKNPSSSIFDLLEAAFNAQTNALLRLYEEQRQMKVEPQQIIAMLSWQLHVLVLVKTAGKKSADEIAHEASISPFVVKKSQRLAEELSLGEINNLISNLLKLDIMSKTKSIDLDDALIHYLLAI